MIQLPEDITPNDLVQWLDGGVFMAQDGPGWSPAKLITIPDHGVVRVEYIGTPRERADLRYADIRPHWPMCGAINHPGGFGLYVQRLQRRQYRRTYNSRCVRVTIPGKWACLKMLSARDMQIDTGSAEFIKELFNPTYPSSVNEALQTLGERASVAVNPHTVFVGRPEPAIYYMGELAGRVSGGEFRPECDPATARRIRKLLGGENASR